VHPANWSNPKATDTYDLAVIGTRTAGLMVAAGAAGLGIALGVFKEAAGFTNNLRS
jgi:predicted flavoprotein YhiN